MSAPDVPATGGPAPAPSTAPSRPTLSRPTWPRPGPGTPRPYTFPVLSRTRLDSGLQVITCHLPGRRVGSARLIMEGGIAREPAGRAGVATLAARTLTEGTESLDAAAFADAVERLGADVSVDAGWDSLQGSVAVPVSRLEPALALLADAVLHPTFQAEEVARLRSERLNDIKQEYADPNQRAQIAFLPTIYTPESPYARPSGGSVDTVARLDRDAIEAHFRRYAGPQDATLIVAGDLDGVDVPAIAERLFGAWRGGEPAPEVPPVSVNQGRCAGAFICVRTQMWDLLASALSSSIIACALLESAGRTVSFSFAATAMTFLLPRAILRRERIRVRGPQRSS